MLNHLNLLIRDFSRPLSFANSNVYPLYNTDADATVERNNRNIKTLSRESTVRPLKKLQQKVFQLIWVVLCIMNDRKEVLKKSTFGKWFFKMAVKMGAKTLKMALNNLFFTTKL